MRSPEAGAVFDPLHHGRRPSFAARLIWQMTSKLRGFQIQTWILDFTGVAHSMKMRRTYQNSTKLYSRRCRKTLPGQCRDHEGSCAQEDLKLPLGCDERSSNLKDHEGSCAQEDLKLPLGCDERSSNLKDHEGSCAQEDLKLPLGCDERSSNVRQPFRPRGPVQC